MTTQGKRIYPENEKLRLVPGGYGRDAGGHWWCMPPGTDLIGRLDAHEITEHDDGTITVSPSILIEGWKAPAWHGWLERGVWREV